MNEDNELKVNARTEEKAFFEKVIEDPMASAYAATGMTALAVCTVLTGMWIVNSAVI